MTATLRPTSMEAHVNESAKRWLFTSVMLTLLLPSSAAAQADDAIRKLISVDYDKAELAGDVDAKMRLYTSDVVLLPPEGSIVVGERAVRAWHERMYKQKTTQITSVVERVEASGDWGVGWGIWRGTVAPTGAQSQTANGKFLVVVRRQSDGSWKIAREVWNAEPMKKQP